MTSIECDDLEGNRIRSEERRELVQQVYPQSRRYQPGGYDLPIMQALNVWSGLHRQHREVKVASFRRHLAKDPTSA